MVLPTLAKAHDLAPSKVWDPRTQMAPSMRGQYCLTPVVISMPYSIDDKQIISVLSGIPYI